MPIAATGSAASRVYPPGSSNRWESAKEQASAAADAKSVAQGLVVTGTSARTKIYDVPELYYGRPPSGPETKGAILALDVNDHSRGDALYFSRYPTDLTAKVDTLLASDSAPGRAYPAFQQMGANGMQLSTELWFCDAFMWSRGKQFVTAYAPEYNGVRNDPTEFQTYAVAKGPLATLAHHARLFFELYTVGHDGTGLALPTVDLFLAWGGSERIIPVVIKRWEMKMEDFTSPPEGRRANYKPGGEPQTITVKLDLEVNIPLRVVDPFKPRQPDKKPPGKRKSRECVIPGYVPGAQQLINTYVLNPMFGGTNSPSTRLSIPKPQQ